MVNFNVISSVKFETLKVGRLMNYLTKNNIWLQEREFDTPEVVCVGCLTLRRHDLVHRETLVIRIMETMQAYIHLTEKNKVSKRTSDCTCRLLQGQQQHTKVCALQTHEKSKKTHDMRKISKSEKKALTGKQ